MKLLPVLSLLLLFQSPVLSHKRERDLISTLKELNLDEFAKKLVNDSPDLVKIVGKRNDITCFAPSNKAVIRERTRTKLAKRANAKDGASLTHTKPSPNNVKQGTSVAPSKKKRTTNDYSDPDSNFEVIYTFLDDPEYVNLGHGNQTLRFSQNYASPSDGRVDSIPQIEVVSGLGKVQKTTRGPFKFKNGLIYEVDDFFTLPEPFSTTMEYLKLAQKFYKLVKKTGNLEDFENLPGVTIFAPIDTYVKDLKVDPRSHIFWSDELFALYHSSDLMPGETLLTYSGDPVTVTFDPETGERLVNCRRLVKPDVVTKNGVIHFIDGPLHGGKPCDNDHSYEV